jgi:DOMON domain-containing protein
MSRAPKGFALTALGAGLALALVLAFSLGVPGRLVSLVARPHAAHQLDGRVEPGEYAFAWTDEATHLRFTWSIVGDRLIGAVSSPDTGWVAVGFGGAGPLMYGADIMMGYVDGRGAHVSDRYASSPTGQDADTALGGHEDILGAAGLQTDSGTTIEFERPLAAHDTTDQPIQSGQTHVIIASENADDFTSYHMGGHKAVVLLDLFAGPPAAAGAGPLLPDHVTDVQILLATFAALLLIMGVHGLIEAIVAQGAGAPADAPVTDMSVLVIVALLVVELAALGTFGVGVALAAPTWLLGLSLGIGLLALAGIVAAYSRVFVRWEIITRERDDGVPW